ncbi:hypothetical protein QVD17_08970 [Tagetes erecta]|uniref:Uncharacterized protein n=1 Tax=Tagetes erecta TaxID=13708 RepID=A0AAD8KYH4_TARER|nr:hypothetical protein QVD17_08970 [Tagetes erecta]
MVMPETGCITCFPIWKSPEEFHHHQLVTIAHVYGNHYVMVQLDGEYPMPCISAYWVRHKAPSVVGWQTMYMARLELYKQLNPCKSDKSVIHIEDEED